MLVYVDDLLIVGLLYAVKDTTKALPKLFTTTDLGEWKHFLGIKINSNPNGTYLTQSAYTTKLI